MGDDDLRGHERQAQRHVERDGGDCRRERQFLERGVANALGAKRDHAWGYLKEIKQPALVVTGSNDVIIYTVNAFILQQHLPNAQLIIYPDSAHGSLFQYPELFVRHASIFLDQKQWT